MSSVVKIAYDTHGNYNYAACTKNGILRILQELIVEGNKLLNDLASKKLDKLEESNEVISLKDMLTESKSLCASEELARRVKKQQLVALAKSIKDELFNVSLLPIKFMDNSNAEKEDGLYTSFLIAKGYDEPKEYSAKSLIGLKSIILNDFNVGDIYSLSCNDKYFYNIKDFFESSQNLLKIKSIKNDGLDELRSFLYGHRDEQFKWIKKQYEDRKKALKEFEEKYFNSCNSGLSIKKEYEDSYYKLKYEGIYDKNDEYMCAEKYIKKDYWEERDLSSNIKELIENHGLDYICANLELQSCLEFEKVKNSIIKIGGSIESIYNVRIGEKGDLNYIADCKDALVNVRTIKAGGYNIQVLHFRTIATLRKIKETVDGKVKKDLSQKQEENILNKLIPTIRESVHKGLLALNEAIVLDRACAIFYKDIENLHCFGYDLEIYEFTRCYSDDKDYPIMLKEFKNVCESLEMKGYIISEYSTGEFAPDGGYSINFGKETIGVGGLLGYSEKDFKKIGYSPVYAENKIGDTFL